MKNILLIDDSEPDNFLHQYLLNKSKKFGRIESVLNVEQAIHLLKEKNIQGGSMPDIILLDINMPRLSGWEFLDEARDVLQFDFSNTQIFMLTTSSNPDDREKANEYDLDGYFLKPLTNDHIEKLLESN